MATENDQAVLRSIFNPDCPFGDDLGETCEPLRDEDSSFDPEVLRRVHDLEVRGVKAAESGDLHSALLLFSEAIEILPDWASAYNNRAQARRLDGDTAGALEDLECAIALSGGTGLTGCQALVQRGLLHKLLHEEDAALCDFQRAARLGSSFARQQALLLNPYAALCNNMLSQVFHKLRNPQAPEKA
ncbi:tetratricopeptide repeat protein 36 [Erpetoichthys calabaricus]|uniref:Tetratricopeptide repeat protein 36 n=1 Tax=Erpetoichthys calabaricus TaxID=27687 RepID=A0A8C4SNE3_ERPCA|nr:tetratricopeptide repeat protein 36 [Erpetoichthys calabaricus]